MPLRRLEGRSETHVPEDGVTPVNEHTDDIVLEARAVSKRYPARSRSIALTSTSIAIR